MGAESKIEWTHHTWNPWRGCEKVSAGCDHCYAETMSRRNPNTLGVWGPEGVRVPAAANYWQLPHTWNRQAEAAGRRHRVFSLSLGDWLEDRRELIPLRARLLDTIAATPCLEWLLLTKRIEGWSDRLHEVVQHDHEDAGLLASHWLDGAAPGNVWLGVSVEDQETAVARIPPLLETPAAVRFVSAEPLLDRVDLTPYLTPWREECGGSGETSGHYSSPDNAGTCGGCGGRGVDRCADSPLHWVIVGGESGPGARPMHPYWARDLRDQCVAAGVAFFFKQWGAVVPAGQGGIVGLGDLPEPLGREGNTTASGYRVGKHRAGRVLDGRTWDEFPAGHEPMPDARFDALTEEGLERSSDLLLRLQKGDTDGTDD